MKMVSMLTLAIMELQIRSTAAIIITHISMALNLKRTNPLYSITVPLDYNKCQYQVRTIPLYTRPLPKSYVPNFALEMKQHLP